ncbi:unnamed protein product [Rotaria sordida]|uniref:Ig-like domain-containing protein n=1 Tax=Rotaria sordida TaxID=392033 RepID=A0A814L4Y1_9BILA|nr:unnamed protein product [Rotaria sordida]CAF0947876.1 unnamed protein product [Rotaria sordida]CAF1060217.1 unnamed protein product [Rotaria sordida]CAF3583106.1 unnamed protein product [Rotaria sordida]
MLYIFVINLIISGLWCQNIKRVIVQQGGSFSFDCQHDETVLFGRRLNEWLEIQEDNEYYLYLNLNFNYLPQENILRVTSNSAQSKHNGYYTCQKSTWISTSKNIIYQIILADVQSFYWNYICHGPIGSCERLDDVVDENLSRFEVADQTNTELFCCASVTGYGTVNIHMNRVGDSFGDVEVNRKQELDGTWVVCANQRTILRRTSNFNQQVLTCELLIDNQHNSMLSSVIIIKDPILPDPSLNYNSYFEENRDNEYFNEPRLSEIRSRRKSMTGKKLAIIIGSVIGGLCLLGLLISFLVCLCRHKNASSSSKMKNSKQYSPVKTMEQTRYKNQTNTQDDEPVYEEPTQLSRTSPIFIRC